MKNKKFKGFSLAELLISLLIISIVLSAAIPTLTRKAGAGREFIWRWSQQQNNNAYFGVGSNQSAIIGADVIPFRGSGLEELFNDGEVNLAGLRFTNNGDKLVLVKKSQNFDDLGSADFNNSHISFYNAGSSKEDATTSDIKYTGRIATGQHDLAFGIGTLQSLAAVDTRNTAIGHYSLLKNTTGIENTAIGEKALSFNVIGEKNTAIGYKSLFNEGFSVDGSGNTDTPKSASNTAVGHLSATALKAGSSNSVLGAQALYTLAKGDDNVVLGSEGLMAAEEGSRNVVIGFQACSAIKSGNNNICIGNKTGIEVDDLNYGLFIGSSENDSQSAIISGYTQKTTSKDETVDKQLNVNARTFSVRPHNGGTNIFKVNAYANDVGQDKGNGYGTGKDGYTGEVFMNFTGDSGNSNEDIGISLSFTGDRGKDKAFNSYPRAIIDSYDVLKPKNTTNKLNLSFNEKIAFIYKEVTNKDNSCADGNVCINAMDNDKGESQTLGINDKLYVKKDINAPKLKISNNSIEVTPANNSTPGSNTDYQVTFNTSGSNSIQLNLSDKDSNPSIKVGQNITISPDSIFGTNGDKFFNISIAKNSTGPEGDVQFSILKNIQRNAESTDRSASPSLVHNFNQVWSAINSLQKSIDELKTTYSDEQLKNISGDNTAGLKEINALEVKNFTFKADKNKTPHVGVIAQQLQKVFPNSVFKGEDGYLKITKDEIFYAMVNSIKELFKQIQDLTAKITGLDKRITELEKQNAQLKKQNAEFEKRLSKLERASR